MLSKFKPQHRVAGHLAVLLLASALHITIGDMNLEGFEQLDAFNPEICGKSFVRGNDGGYVHDELRASRIRKHSYGRTRGFNYNDHDQGGRRSLASGSHYDTSGRMSGGWRAQEGEIPWFVLLETKFSRHEGNNISRCGGVLIHNDLVLTASHCVEDQDAVRPNYIKMILGIHLLNDFSNVRYAVKHCGFADEGPQNRRDIALVWLDSPVAYGKKIQPACLDLRQPVEPDNCFTAGYGETNTTKIIPQPLMVAEQRECGYSSRQYDICWIGKGIGNPCHGDSGGGLFCMRDRRAYARGVVSRGPKACLPGNDAPVWYSDAYLLRDQIQLLFEDCNWEPSKNLNWRRNTRRFEE